MLDLEVNMQENNRLQREKHSVYIVNRFTTWQ